MLMHRKEKPVSKPATKTYHPDLADIQPLHEREQMVKLISAISADKELLKSLNLERADGYQGQWVAGPKHDRQADALQLLNGVDIDELQGEHTESKRETLTRKIDALEAKISMQENILRKMTTTEIRGGCILVNPQAKEKNAKTVEALETLLECLEDEDKFYTDLGRLGYSTGHRPGHFQLAPWESRLLHGGQGQGCLQYLITGLKDLWQNAVVK